KPYYTDISALATTASSAKRSKNLVQQLFTLWNTLTGFPINSLEKLQPIIENPSERYAKLVEAGKKTRDGEIIRLPAGFHDIQRIAQDLKQVNLSHFQLDHGTVTLSPDHYRRRVNRVFFFAVTPEQQKRHKYAEQLVKLIKQQENFYVEEMGNASAFRWSPVPTGIRLHYQGGKVTPVVDEKWITKGFEGEVIFNREKEKHEPYGNYRIAKSE